ncbi:MAG TPA: hypothetical protein VHH35_21110 [Pyrinomonadaceae bacterium]|nr:hypothetical protein [Pyrinomonadaceae bacterium]
MRLETQAASIHSLQFSALDLSLESFDRLAVCFDYESNFAVEFGEVREREPAVLWLRGHVEFVTFVEIPIDGVGHDRSTARSDLFAIIQLPVCLFDLMR